MGLVLALLQQQWVGLWVALLPAPERTRLARRHELDPPRWSLEIGFIQTFAGAGLFVVGGLAFLRPATVDQSMLLLHNWFPGLSTTHFQGLGLINWFAWFVYPASWPWVYLAVVGVVRCTAFAVTREAVAEPVVWAGLRAVQHLRATAARRRFEGRLGPARPDRLLRHPQDRTAVVVLTCRQKPGWTESATIEIGERYYRVQAVEQRQDGDWICLAYRLREQPQGAVIRRLVRYEPPAA